jgi:hypothetical protein
VVGARGFEPRASCAQGSCKKSILLVRLALFYVMLHGFGPNSAAFGLKLDPSFSLQLGRRQAGPTPFVPRTHHPQSNSALAIPESRVEPGYRSPSVEAFREVAHCVPIIAIGGMELVCASQPSRFPTPIVHCNPQVTLNHLMGPMD